MEKRALSLSEVLSCKKRNEQMSNGSQVDDKARRPSVTKKVKTCMCAECESMECGHPQVESAVSVGVGSGQSISLEPTLVPLDPSIQIPAGYKPKCIAFPKRGDCTLSLNLGEICVATHKDGGSFPVLILQKIRWRAKHGYSYQYIELNENGCKICVAIDEDSTIDKARYASGNYFKMTLADECGDAEKALKGFQACWSQFMEKENEK